MKRRRSLQALAALGTLGVPAWLCRAHADPANPPVPPAGVGGNPDGTAMRRLRFTLTLINPHQRALLQQRFWCYLPADLPPAQRLAQVQVSMPHAVETDALGQRILALNFDQVAPLAQKVVAVTALVASQAQPAAGSLADAGAWLKPERFIEASHALIRARAAQLQGATPLQTMRAIYDFVRQHLHYAGYVADDLGALYALTQRSGDCTEYADLVVALARACGIPARMMGGYVTALDTSVRGQDYHNWAEVFLDGDWRVVDAQKEQWLAPRANYIAFRIYRDVAMNAVGLAHRYRMAGDLQVNL